MTPSKKQNLPTLPSGYVFKLFGRETKEHVAGDVEIKDKGKLVMTLENVRHPMPVTHAALEAAFEKYELEIVDVDGEKHTLKGADAAAAAKFLHSIETVRGKGRSGKVSESEVRDAFLSYTQVSGGERSGFQQKKVGEKEIADLTVDELKALLRDRGMVKSEE